MIAGCDKHGPRLFFCDPSGTFLQYKAKAIGSGSEGAQSSLQEEYSARSAGGLLPSLQEAEVMTLKILKHVMEDKIDCNNVEVASVTPQGGFKAYSADEVSRILVSI